MPTPRTKPKRRYSDEQRVNALAALAANNGNLHQTSRQIGIPVSTLECWAKKLRHPEASVGADEKKKELSDAIEDVARSIADSLIGKLDDASFKDATVGFGILIDKMKLLRGEPTSINEQRDRAKLDEFDKRYNSIHPEDNAAETAGLDGQG